MHEQNTSKNPWKKAGKRKQNFQKFCQIINHCMPEWTSSTRNDYQRKISYDWSNLLIVNCNKYNPLINA